MIKITAHRGSKGTHPENTLAAFSEAVRTGADAIELDVHLSKDGEIIVMHDELLDRTTNGSGRICDLTLAELKELDAGSWFNQHFLNEKIPTLSEVTDLLTQLDYRGDLNIELKTDVIHYEGIERKTHEWMSSQPGLFSFMYSSFYFPSLEILAKIAPTVSKGLIMFSQEEVIDKGLKTTFIDSLHPEYLWSKQKSWTYFSSFPKKVRVWTVNEEDEMKKCMSLGLTSLMTDFPEKAIQIRAEWVEGNEE